LRDLRSGEDFISPVPTRDESEILASAGSVERAVKIEHAGESFVSVYVGTTTYSGGAHAINTLDCRTFDRRTGRAIALSDLRSEVDSRRIVDRGRAKSASHAARTGDPTYRVESNGFLYDEQHDKLVLCAVPPQPLAGSVLLLSTDD